MNMEITSVDEYGVWMDIMYKGEKYEGFYNYEEVRVFLNGKEVTDTMPFSIREKIMEDIDDMNI
jgi:hypothetical protein